MRAGGATLRILPSIGHLVIFIAIALLAKFRRAGEIIPVDIAAVAARAGIEAFGVAVVSMVVFLIASVDSEGVPLLRLIPLRFSSTPWCWCSWQWWWDVLLPISTCW